MENPMQNALKPDLLENALVLIAFQDLDNNIQWANKAYQYAAGLPLDKIVGKKCYSLWGLTKLCLHCPVSAAIKTGRLAKAELTAENQEQWPHPQFGLMANATPIRDMDGAIIGAVVTAFNLTEYITLRNRQERTMAALLRLLDYAPSHSAHELLREFLDEVETLTKSRIGFYHFVEDDQVSLSLQVWSSNTMKVCSAPGAGTHYLIQQAGVWVDCVRQGAPVIHNDYPSLPHKKGLPEGHAPVVRELVVPVIRDGKLVAILGVGNKETDYDEYDVKVVGQLAELAWETVVRKRAEEENRRLQAQFVQAQKMESVGRLAGGVAHDFNNMLSVILGHVDMALEKITVTQPIYSDLLAIRNAAQRSANLTRQLLAFARHQTIDPRVLDLNEIVGDMLKMLRRLIGEDIDPVWKPDSDLGLVKMDPAQIDQILANLCVNARDAISGVGKITIETHNVTFDEAYCAEHLGFLPGAYVMLAVSDDGCGMDQGTLANIFEPFFTTKQVGEGTGLGLAMVYGIVKQNNGFINVYSEPNRGTTFKIYLPRHEEGEETSRIEIDSQFPQGGNETILLVEDESMILGICKSMLENLGYQVLAANTPREALCLAKDNPEHIDLLVTDVVMPEITGHDLATQLEATRPDLKTLYMSGYTANVIAHHDVLKEGVVFLQKPFSKKELAAKIREAITQKKQNG